MCNFICKECGITNVDCGMDGYKTPQEIELEKELSNCGKSAINKPLSWEELVEIAVREYAARHDELVYPKNPLQSKVLKFDNFEIFQDGSIVVWTHTVKTNLTPNEQLQLIQILAKEG